MPTPSGTQACSHATWPSEASAVSLPFTHRATEDPALSHATLIYELTMHHYVLHLQAIGSPYAFHTLGSSCVIHSHAYAAVRGMPLRNAAEDFYLLNKLAKVGPVHCARGAGVQHYLTTIEPSALWHGSCGGAVTGRKRSLRGAALLSR